MMAAEQLRSCRGEVEGACAMLLTPTPEALDGCSAVLAGAARSLAALGPVLAGARGDPDALEQTWRLQRAVRLAGVLLRNASAYHEGWSASIGVKAAGYRPDGEPGETPRRGRLSVRG